MQIDGAQRRSVPYHFGQHPERNDHLDVGLQCAELFEECRILQAFWLQHGKTEFECTQFHFGTFHCKAAARRSVRCGYDAHHVHAGIHKRIQCACRETWCAKENDALGVGVGCHAWAVQGRKMRNPMERRPLTRVSVFLLVVEIPAQVPWKRVGPILRWPQCMMQAFACLAAVAGSTW